MDDFLSIWLKLYSHFFNTRLICKTIQAILSISEDHWSCIAHLCAEEMLKSALIEEKKFKNIESE